MAAKWRVVSQRQTEQLTAGGQFEATVIVDFELASGTRGSVKIPSRLYSEDYVRQQVTLLADQMDGVENLSA